MTEVYVDGSYRLHSDGKLKGGIGIFFGNNDQRNAAITVANAGGESMDNQAMECLAIYIALLITKDLSSITIYSDSKHAIDCLTIQYSELSKNGWLTKKNKAIAQKKILKECGTLIDLKILNKDKVELIQVPGHKGITGNEGAHFLAFAASGLDWNKLTDNTNRIVLLFTPDTCNFVADDVQITSLCETVNKYSSQINKLDSDNLTSKLPNKPSNNPKHKDNELTGFYNFNNSLNMDTSIAYSSRSVSPTELQRQSEYERLSVNSNTAYLFYSCIQCLHGIVIQFPQDTTKKSMKEIASIGSNTISYTVCKGCITKSKGDASYENITKAGIEFNKAMQQLCLSPNIFQLTPIYGLAKQLCDSNPIILATNDKVKFTPIDSIAKICDNNCIVQTIDMHTKEIMPYLRFGFLF